MSTQLLVHNPMGYPPQISAKPLAPRLDTLDGRTVYLVDCRFDDSDILLKAPPYERRETHGFPP